jgi:hypothetical protein
MFTLTSSSVRAKIHEGLEEYQVTGGDMPSFLFEDPDKVDPENVLAGFMRGFFLARVRIHKTL